MARSRRTWAQNQAFFSILGDARLERRFARILQILASKPSDSIPQACGHWAETKATYRFIENDHFDWSALRRPITEATARACDGLDSLLLIQDTTTLVFPYANQTRGLGPINKTASPGMFAHSALATDEDGVAIGLLDLHMWARDWDDPTTARQRQNWPIERKESYRWIEAMRRSRQALKANLSADNRPRLIHVQDREGDIYEVFGDIMAADDGAVIRARHDRTVVDETSGEAASTGHAFEMVAQAPLLGTETIDVPRRRNERARTARIELRARRFTLRPTSEHGDGPAITLNLLEVAEVNAPKSVKKPLRWLLWTTESLDTFDQAMRVVGIYKCRWRIEDYHYTLKSGCHIEDLRMDTIERVMKTVMLYAPVAVRIVRLRDLARLSPEAPCTKVLTRTEWHTLWIAIHHKPLPRGQPPPTLRQAALWIGRLGGHLNRKSDGMPGAKVLWRGWRDLDLLVAYHDALS